MRRPLEADAKLVWLGYVREAGERLESLRGAVVRSARRDPPDYQRVLARVTQTLAAARGFGGQLEEACRLYGEGFFLWQHVGDVRGMTDCLTMDALLGQLHRPRDAEAAQAAEGKLLLIYHRLGERDELPHTIRGTAARDLASTRRQVAPEDTVVERYLDQALDILAAAPRPSRWQFAMTHLGRGQTWLNRHRARTAAGAVRSAEAALAQAGSALAAARQAMPLGYNMASVLKLETAEADLRSRRGETEAALAQARDALAVARDHGIGLHVSNLERMVQQLERAVT